MDDTQQLLGGTATPFDNVDNDLKKHSSFSKYAINERIDARKICTRWSISRSLFDWRRRFGFKQTGDEYNRLDSSDNAITDQQTVSFFQLVNITECDVC